jgi:pimeloyl-ACP methyl ester carboxylesterase
MRSFMHGGPDHAGTQGINGRSMSGNSSGEQPPILVTDEEGTGPPLLFLHALGASGRYWREGLGMLPDRYRCLMPDLLGFGRSPKPECDYTVDDHLVAIRGTLRRLRTAHEPLVIVGHSLGAILAAEYAARYPTSVAGLILLGLPRYASNAEAVAYISEHGQWMARITVRNGRMAHAVHRGMVALRPLLALLVPLLVRDMPRPIAADALRHTWQSYSGTLAHCILSHDVTPALTVLTGLPILALHGEDDPAAPIASVRALAATIPNLTLVAMGDGHHLFLPENAACLTAIQGYLRNTTRLKAFPTLYPTGV